MRFLVYWENTTVNRKDGFEQLEYFLFIGRSFDHYSGIFHDKGEIKPKINFLDFQKISFNRTPLIQKYKANFMDIEIKRHLVKANRFLNISTTP